MSNVEGAARDAAKMSHEQGPEPAQAWVRVPEAPATLDQLVTHESSIT